MLYIDIYCFSKRTKNS